MPDPTLSDGRYKGKKTTRKSLSSVQDDDRDGEEGLTVDEKEHAEAELGHLLEGGGDSDEELEEEEEEASEDDDDDEEAEEDDWEEFQEDSVRCLFPPFCHPVFLFFRHLKMLDMHQACRFANWKKSQTKIIAM